MDQPRVGPAGGELPPQDATLLADLGEVFDLLDPVPPEVVSAARESVTWRTVDAELAALVADSVLLEGAVRGTEGPRLLTFEGPGVTVEVEVADDARRRRILGQVVPPGPGSVEVRGADGRRAVQTDAMGRFTVADLPPGPVSLVCRPSSAPNAVVTDWVTI